MVSENGGGGGGGGGVVITPSWVEEPEPSKSHWRPPVYNGEDYAAGLLWRTTQHQQQQQLHHQQPAAELPPHHHEMTLRQFTSTSDLLAKLTNDLTHAYPSFVQEFVGQPVDGVTLLLELLRTIQVSQGGTGGGCGGGGGGGVGTSRRQSLMDELACLQCLMLCMRCPDTPRRLTISSAGLFTLTACVMSNLNKSRILALQILRKVCEQSSGKGYGPVSDAMSTMRLRFGEPVRFRLLCGTLTSPACSPQLLLAGIGFVNSFLEAAPSAQARLYLQAELEQAGFKPDSMVKGLQSKGNCNDALRDELSRWQRLFVDVNNLKSKEGELSKEVTKLKDRINFLETRIQVLQEEKSIVSRSESRLKSRCDLLEREVNSLRSGCSGSGSGGGEVGVMVVGSATLGHGGGEVRSASTPAEDEGISSSGQEDVSLEREPLVYQVYHRNPTILNKPKEDEETTIEEVMEEFQNIINDAESDYKDRADKKSRKAREDTTLSRHFAKFMQRSSVTGQVQPSKKITANDHGEGFEELEEKEIVPVHMGPGPPPPRRPTCPLYVGTPVLHPRDGRYLFFEEEEDLDEDQEQLHCQDTAPNSDSVLSGSEDHLYQEYYPIPGGLKRSETFHNTRHVQTCWKSSAPRAIADEGGGEGGDTAGVRRGSFDGLFYYSDAVARRRSIGNTNSNSTTRIYVEAKNAEQRMPPEDERPAVGIDAIVDIVLTRQAEEPKGTRYPADRTVFLPIRNDPSPNSTQKFVVKRGQTNAGLYSGTPAAVTCRITTPGNNDRDYYPRNLGTLNRAGFTISPGTKISDLPSGLY